MQRSPLLDLPLEPFLHPPHHDGHHPQPDESQPHMPLKRPLSPEPMIISPQKRRILAQEGVLLAPKFKLSSLGLSGSSTRPSSGTGVRFSPYLPDPESVFFTASAASGEPNFKALISSVVADAHDAWNQGGGSLQSAFTACSTTASSVASPSLSTASTPKMTRSSPRLLLQSRSKPPSSSSSPLDFGASFFAASISDDVEMGVASMALGDVDEDDDDPKGYSKISRDRPPSPDRSSEEYPGFDVYREPYTWVAPPRDLALSASRVEIEPDEYKENSPARRRIRKSVGTMPTTKSESVSANAKLDVIMNSPPSTPRKGLRSNANMMLERTPVRRSARLNGPKDSPSRSPTKRGTRMAVDSENEGPTSPVKKRRRGAASVFSDDMNVD